MKYYLNIHFFYYISLLHISLRDVLFTLRSLYFFASVWKRSPSAIFVRSMALMALTALVLFWTPFVTEPRSCEEMRNHKRQEMIFKGILKP